MMPEPERAQRATPWSPHARSPSGSASRVRRAASFSVGIDGRMIRRALTADCWIATHDSRSLPRLVRDLVDLDAALTARPGAPRRAGAGRPSWRAPCCAALLEPRLLVRMSVMPAHSSTDAHRATGDDAGTGRGRLEQHLARAVMPDHLVRDRRSRRAAPRPCCACAASTALRTASDTSFALPVAIADPAAAVAHRHEGVEREAPAALHDLGHAVDRDDVLDQLAAVALAVAIAPPGHHGRRRHRPGHRGRRRRRRHRAAGAAARPPGGSRRCRRRGSLGRPIACSSAIRTPVRPRARPRRRPSRGRDTGSRRGRTRPW